MCVINHRLNQRQNGAEYVTILLPSADQLHAKVNGLDTLVLIRREREKQREETKRERDGERPCEVVCEKQNVNCKETDECLSICSFPRSSLRDDLVGL